MKPFFASFILLALVISGRAEDQPWSESVNGLRARLSIERAEDSPFLKVFLEIQNTSDVAGLKTIRFTPDSITPTVTNTADRELHRANGPYDGMSPDWTPLKLPFEGTMRFRINFPGLGYDPERDKIIVDLGSLHTWSIPEEGRWFLSASLNIAARQGDHPSMDWSGVILLPKVPLPQGTQEGEHDVTPNA